MKYFGKDSDWVGRFRCLRKASGFTVVELSISMGLTALLVVGFIAGAKIFTHVNDSEQLKTKLQKRHQQAQQNIGEDLQQAIKLKGSTAKYYFPVSRRLSDPTDPLHPYNESDPFDNLVIFKNYKAQILGATRVLAPQVGEDWFSVYYILENPDSPTLTDQYFRKAFQHKKYFFLSNTDNRNIIENLDFHSANAASIVNCPPCASTGACDKKCYKFRGGYGEHENIGDFDKVSDILSILEVSSYETNIRVGEKITYEVDSQHSQNCPAGTLCRLVDDNESSATPVLDGLDAMEVSYTFSASSAGNAIAPGRPLRSPFDPQYLSQAGEHVTFADVDDISISFSQILPHDLSSVIHTTDANSAFRMQNGSVLFGSKLKIRPGGDFELSSSLDQGTDLDPECSSLDVARCNPSGKCNYLFTSSNSAATNWTGYKYLEDPVTRRASDLCLCGWSGQDHRFYDPYKFPTKIPFYNAATEDYWYPPGVSYRNLSPGIDSAGTRINACVRLSDCGATIPTVSARHPLCNIAKNCMRPTITSQVYTKQTGFNQDLIETMTASRSNQYIYCMNSKNNFCDWYYDMWKNVPAGTNNVWADTCACVLKENYVNPSTGVSSLVAIPNDAVDNDSLCHVQNAQRACTNTWNADPDGTGIGAWILDDATNPQGLTAVQAELCACRMNNTAGFPLSQPANPLPENQKGSNQIAIQDGSGYGPGGLWTWVDSQFRWPQRSFDFRVDNTSTAVTLPLLQRPATSGICGYYRSGQARPHAKCLSNESQVAQVKTIRGATISNYQVNCSKSQRAIFNGATKGGCIASAHTETDPANWPINLIGPTHPLYSYRFFCDPSCNSAVPNDPYWFEINYIRNLILTAANNAPRDSSWCPDRSYVSGGGGATMGGN